MTKNYGINLDLEAQHRSEQDWVFGAESPKDIAQIPEAIRTMYLPRGEVQRGQEDLMDCATRGPINVLETKFSWLYRNKKLKPENLKWLEDKGYVDTEGKITFSDAFIAINSHTTRQGNSLIAPLDAIRKCGLIPKKLLPLEPSMTFDEYHNPQRITRDITQLGLEFLKRFTLARETVMEKDYGTLLLEDMLIVAGFAWPQPINGEYPKSGNQPNHCFIIFNEPKYYAFDNYLDVIDNDFVKKLTGDYDFLDYGYRIIITSENVVSTPVATQPTGFWYNIFNFIRNYIAEIFK